VSFGEVQVTRGEALREAFVAFERRPGSSSELDRFRRAEREWLEDYVLFCALKDAQGGRAWTTWPDALRRRDPGALARAREELAAAIRFHAFVQLVFAAQWRSLRERAVQNGVWLIGDVPIFVAHDSADVWAHPELFALGPDGAPRAVAGVPPDYFSATGQRWGNPLYEWRVHAADGFAWWIARMQNALSRFDAVRLDHFIGFYRYWEIAATCPTAEEGVWRKGPRDAFFLALESALGGGHEAGLPLLAEDLGCTTPGVRALRDRFRFPGTKVLQFAFGHDPSAPDFLPHAYRRRSVVYTGTHDNDTAQGWYDDPRGEKVAVAPADGGRRQGRGGDDEPTAQNERERQKARDYLGLGAHGDVPWAFVRAALASVATTAIIPLQDLLGLGSAARMNRPGTTQGNWSWRATAADLSPVLAARLASLTTTFGRARRQA
jgi:4-alpha-glucanotransferase